MGGRYCAINSPLYPRWGQKSLDLQSRDLSPHHKPRSELNGAIPCRFTIYPNRVPHRRRIEPSHKAHSAWDKYPIMHHFVPETCIHVHIAFTKWSIVGNGTSALWDLRIKSIAYLVYEPIEAEKMATILQTLFWNAFFSNGNNNDDILQVYNCRLYLRLKRIYTYVTRDQNILPLEYELNVYMFITWAMISDVQCIVLIMFK